MPQSPLSLYIHFPWCVRKCPYCDFNSHKAGDNAPRDRYVDALVSDLELEGKRSSGRTVNSIFLGGGTPSFFTPDEIAAVLNAAMSSLVVSPDCEVSMEANPGTIERGSLAAYRQAGVTRLSLGAQSFDANKLAVLGRIHSPDDVRRAYEEACAADFDSINIDLMFALPGQDLAGAISDISSVLELAPPHISYYQLTLEPNTVFYKHPPRGIPDDELAWTIQERCHELLQDAGYQQYEISAFSREGHRCHHNLNYWMFGDYLAAGAGAHGKLTDAEGIPWRYQKPAHPLTYIEAMGRGDCDVGTTRVNDDEIAFEFMLNALRLQDGFSEHDFIDRTGLAMAAIEAPLASAQDDGLIERSAGGDWRPTAAGFRFLNDLQGRFLP
jgi:putative oxygen-independent coproporphyrinogen III oxidase